MTKLLIKFFGVLLLLAVLPFACLEQDPVPGFAKRKGRLVRVVTERIAGEEGHRIELTRLVSSSDLAVDLSLKRPTEPPATPRSRAAVLILGGHRTGRDAVALIPATRGTVVAAMSYPFGGDHRAKGLALASSVPAIRRALADTVPAIQLAIDHLVADEEVDPTRIELVGVSLGAPFVCVAGGLDERPRRVWSIHGGGDNHALLEHNLAREVEAAWLRVPAAYLLNRLDYGNALSPERFVGRIAPREFVMINGVADERVPRQLVELLYAAAEEPKQLIWREGGHLRKSDTDVVQGLIDLVLDRVLETPDPGAAPDLHDLGR